MLSAASLPMAGWLGSRLPGWAIDEAGAIQQPEDPFVWSGGGAMITPDELARRREIADAQSRADFSPVAHWTQGLGRVLENVSGALETRKLDRLAEQSAARGQSVAEALVAGGTGQASVVARALADPTLPREVRQLAELQFRAANKQPHVNDTEADMMLFDRRLGSGKGDEWLASKLDPIVNIPTPYGPYFGPQSKFAETMARFQQGGAAPAKQPPATLPPDFDFDEGGPSSKATAPFPVSSAQGFVPPMSLPGGSMTSGRRTVEGNRMVGGVPNSAHLSGEAVDYDGPDLAALLSQARKLPGVRKAFIHKGHVHTEGNGWSAPYYGKRGTFGLRKR